MDEDFELIVKKSICINAKRLLDDATVMMSAGRYDSAAFLAATALEECTKAWVFSKFGRKVMNKNKLSESSHSLKNKFSILLLKIGFFFRYGRSDGKSLDMRGLKHFDPSKLIETFISLRSDIKSHCVTQEKLITYLKTVDSTGTIQFGIALINNPFLQRKWKNRMLRIWKHFDLVLSLEELIKKKGGLDNLRSSMLYADFDFMDQSIKNMPGAVEKKDAEMFLAAARAAVHLTTRYSRFLTFGEGLTPTKGAFDGLSSLSEIDIIPLLSDRLRM